LPGILFISVIFGIKCDNKWLTGRMQMIKLTA
jgi:hypothetical protein